MTWLCQALFPECSGKFVLIAAIAQFMCSFIYYTTLIGKPFKRQLLVDKGITTVSALPVRNTVFVCILSSLFSCFVQAEIISAVHKKMGLKKTLGGYIDVSLWVAVGVIVFAHQKFWGQRPAGYIVFDVINNILTCLVAGATLFYAPRYF